MTHFDTLGVMLDCSRNAVIKPDSLKKFIDIISKMGYNMLQLYTEDTFEVDGEPYFGYLRGRYPKAELKQIDSYAAQKGVELIPCIQTLAHFSAIVRWKEYEDAVDCNDILLAGEKRTYKLIDNIFATLSQCFTSRRVNIGMDEAHMVGLGKYLDKHGYKDRFGILSEHLQKVCQIAAKYGFKPLMWSDMFFRLANNGNYTVNGTHSIDKITHLVPKEVELIYWDYYSADRTRYDNMLNAHSAFDNPVWFAGGCWSWQGFTPHNQFSIDATRAAFESCIESGIKNVFLTMWGDNGGECSFFSLLPSLMFGACMARGVTDIAVIAQEFERVVGVKWDDMLMLDLPNRVGVNRPTTQNPSKYILFNDLFMGIFDATVHPDDSQPYNQYAAKLKKLTNHKEYGYLFESAYRHCRVLELKFDLGIRTRERYRKGDKKGLELLIKDYALLIKRVKDFYIAFRNLWETENKPHGFDVQDHRFGGLLMRIDNCKRRLELFVSGQTDKIEELEEDILTYYDEHHIQRAVSFNNWAKTITANII